MASCPKYLEIIRHCQLAKFIIYAWTPEIRLTSHTRGIGGLSGPGGSVVAGSRSFESCTPNGDEA